MGSIADLGCPQCGRTLDKDSEMCDVCVKRNRPSSSQDLVAAALQSTGVDVASPHRENAPYDLLIKGDGGWSQVQIKTAYQTGSGVRVNVCRTTDTGREPYGSEDVDVFACVWEKDVWLIPFTVVEGKSRISLLAGKYSKWKVKW